MATTTEVAEARQRLNDAQEDLAQFQSEWAALQGEDAEFKRTSRPSDNADPAWHRRRADIADRMEQAAIRSLEVRREVDRAEEALRLILAETHESLREKSEDRLHQLGIDLDVLLDAVSPLVSEILTIERELYSSRKSASIPGPNSSRRERALASALVRRLGVGELRRTEWTQFRVPTRLAELYPEFTPKPDAVDVLEDVADELAEVTS